MSPRVGRDTTFNDLSAGNGIGKEVPAAREETRTPAKTLHKDVLAKQAAESSTAEAFSAPQKQHE